MSEDAFDVDKLALADGQVAVVPRKIQKRRQHFIKVPWAWVEQLAKARHVATYRVALHLLYEHWKQKGGPVKLPNGMLAMGGVGRRSKWRALAELENLGLVRVERRTRKSPLVTLIV